MPNIIQQNSFLLESYFYIISAGLIQISFLLLIAVVVIPYIYKAGLKKYIGFMTKFIWFNVLLLFWGCIGHYTWHNITFNKYYVSMDRVVDWFPYIPFGNWVLKQEFNGRTSMLLNGTPMIKLQMIWALIALVVWGLSWFTYKITNKKLLTTGCTECIPQDTV